MDRTGRWFDDLKGRTGIVLGPVHKMWNAKMADDDEKQSLLPFDINSFQKKLR